MKKTILLVIAILLLAVFSGCVAEYKPQAGKQSTTKAYTIMDREENSYLVEPTKITRNNVLELQEGYDEIDKKCDIIAFSDFTAYNGEAYSASSSVSLLVKVRSCHEKVDTIN